MCLGGSSGPGADYYYDQIKVEPEPLPELPTSGEKVERRQRRGLRNKPLGGEQRTLLNIGDSNV